MGCTSDEIYGNIIPKYGETLRLRGYNIKYNYIMSLYRDFEYLLFVPSWNNHSLLSPTPFFNAPKHPNNDHKHTTD